jgi:hypothetical protein
VFPRVAVSPRLWDLEDMQEVSASAAANEYSGPHSASYSTSSHRAPVGGAGAKKQMGMGGRRTSLAAMIVGGSDPLASVFVLKSIGAVTPDKTLQSTYGRMSSASVLHHPHFSSGCYVVCSKGNTFGILQDRGLTGGNEETGSESSVSLASSEKGFPLVLLQEFSVHSMMQRYFAEVVPAVESNLMPALSEAWRSEAGDAAAVRVYAVRSHPAQPSMFLVLTSVGLIVASIGRPQVRISRVFFRKYL